MKIKAQNGNIEVFLGEYFSRERATEVYVEATELGWSEENPVYIVPAEQERQMKIPQVFQKRNQLDSGHGFCPMNLLMNQCYIVLIFLFIYQKTS